MMARRVDRNRIDEPRPRGDEVWIKLPIMHRILSELLKDETPSWFYRSKRHLFEWARNGKRVSKTKPIRSESLRGSFWLNFKAFEKALSSTNSLARTKDRPDPIFGWDYYGWKPHFDELCSGLQLEQNERARGEPPEPAAAPPLPGPARLPAPVPVPVPAAPPRPQQRRRAPGGGMKRKLKDSQIEKGKQLYRDMLADDPTWADQKQASAKRVIEKLKFAVHWRTVERHIIEPVLDERLTE